jgi:subtilase family serine protease
MTGNSRPVSGLAFAALAAAAVATGTAHSGTATTPSSVALSGAAPTWIAQAIDLGATSGQEQLTVQVHLAGRDPAGLAAYARAVSSPNSPLFHRYLSATQDLRRFGPDPAQTARLESWLKGTGLAVAAPSPQELVVHGTVAEADTAFDIHLHDYFLAGKRQRSPQSAPRLPSGIAADVVGISGLDTTSDAATHARRPSPIRGPDVRHRPRRARTGVLILDDP